MEKTCAICRLAYPVEEFRECARTRDGRWNYCQMCDRRQNRRRYVEGKTGVAWADWDEVLSRQGFACALCGVRACDYRRNGRPAVLVADCEERGGEKVLRGILCHQCKERADWVRSGEYAEWWNRLARYDGMVAEEGA